MSNSPPQPAPLDNASKASRSVLSLDSPITLAPPIDLDMSYLGYAYSNGLSSKSLTPPRAESAEISPESRSPATPEVEEPTIPSEAATPKAPVDLPPPAAETTPAPAPPPDSAASAAVAATAAILFAASTKATVPPSVATAAATPAVVAATANATEKETKAPEEQKEPEQIPPSKAPFRARHQSRMLSHQSSLIAPDPSITLSDLTRELERALDSFRYPMQGGGPERSMTIRNELLLYCSELDKRCYSRKEEAQYHDLREVCFEWGDALLYELRVEQPANERGACLEGLAAILECSALTADALQLSPNHQDAFMQLMMRVMTFVMDKLGAKGVFHNTLLFSGRFLVSTTIVLY